MFNIHLSESASHCMLQWCIKASKAEDCLPLSSFHIYLLMTEEHTLANLVCCCVLMHLRLASRTRSLSSLVENKYGRSNAQNTCKCVKGTVTWTCHLRNWFEHAPSNAESTLLQRVKGDSPAQTQLMLLSVQPLVQGTPRLLALLACSARSFAEKPWV